MKTPGSISKSKAELELSGALARNPKRYADRANEPTPSGEIGEAPVHFDPAHKAIWNEIVANSLPGTLGNSDRVILELVVSLLWSLRDGSIRSMDKSLLLSGLQQLGMSPVTRSRIAVAKPTDNENAFDDLILPIN